jgi:hypothetical protein
MLRVNSDDDRFGNRYLVTILSGDAPMDSAAFTYACSFRLRTLPRVSRAKTIQPLTLRTTTMRRGLGPRIARIVRASSKPGNAT